KCLEFPPTDNRICAAPNSAARRCPANAADPKFTTAIRFTDLVGPLGFEPRTNGSLDCISENVHASQNRLTRVLTSYNLFCHWTLPSWVFDTFTTFKLSSKTITSCRMPPWPFRRASPRFHLRGGSCIPGHRP